MKTRLTLLGTAAVLALAPMAALADVSANVALTSKYKYRGQDQSDPAKGVLPAIQGGFDYSSGGFYLGNWNSSVGGQGTEMDVYRGEAGPVAYDVGALLYIYPGAGALNTTELYASVGFGPASLKYSSTVSKEYFGVLEGRGTGYLELKLSFPLGDKITLVGVLGNTLFSSGAKSAGALNYTDYKLGADFAVAEGYTLGLALVGANKDGPAEYGDLNKRRVVLTLTKSL
jgi:uncharacterized protein (TIGR02001 family)